MQIRVRACVHCSHSRVVLHRAPVSQIAAFRFDWRFDFKLKSLCIIARCGVVVDAVACVRACGRSCFIASPARYISPNATHARLIGGGSPHACVNEYTCTRMHASSNKRTHAATRAKSIITSNTNTIIFYAHAQHVLQTVKSCDMICTRMHERYRCLYKHGIDWFMRTTCWVYVRVSRFMT